MLSVMFHISNLVKPRSGVVNHSLRILNKPETGRRTVEGCQSSLLLG